VLLLTYEVRGEQIGIDRVCFATDGRSRESSKNKPGFQSARRQKYANPGTREIAGNPPTIREKSMFFLIFLSLCSGIYGIILS
jgi:hypothetical protein